MTHQRHIGNLFTAVLLAGAVANLSSQTINREIKKTTEKEVKVKITASFGSVNIERGDPDKIVAVYFRPEHKESEPQVDLDYSVRNGVGDLRMEMHPKGVTVSSNGEDHDIHITAKDFNFKTGEWYIRLGSGVPLDINAELGAGKNNFDFTGMTVSDLAISTGASSSTVMFDTKNEGEIDEFKIETGVSKFVAEKLNNANFRRLSFDGGVGSYFLDFGGQLDRSVSVDVNVGLGAVTLQIPEGIGVRIHYDDSWLSNLTVDDDFIRVKKGIYESENYDDARGRMNISVESGLGSVKIKRSR